MMKKVLYYTNQFFGQVGGEDKAYHEPEVYEGMKGSANSFSGKLQDSEIVKTIICGDNYYVENMDKVKEYVSKIVEAEKFDFMIAGPAFNAGRFGIACADICSYVEEKYGIVSLTGLYWENPAVEMYRKNIYIIETDKSAAGIRKAVPAMAKLANKLLKGEEIGLPKEEGYFAKGKRINIFSEKNGAQRALEMLVKKLKGEEYKTEVEVPSYDQVNSSMAIKDLKNAKVALLTTGGIVIKGNPDKMPAATAKYYKNYNIEFMDTLKSEDFESVHAGYDPVYANNDPNRVAPLDVLRDMEKQGEIREIYKYLVSTTGNSTSVSDATRMGQEISIELKESGVDFAIMTST